jgi:hypothetical protein
MLPARRRAIQKSVLAAIVVAIVGYWVSHTLRSRLFEGAVFFSGENGMRHWEAAVASFARGDGYPLWDRTTCGGGPGLADPESLLLSSLVAGTFGIRGDVMGRWYPTLAMTLAVAGTYLWCRRALSIGRIGSSWAGVVFVASGFVVLQTSQRMLFVPFLFIPWVLYLARAGEKSLIAAAGAGVVLATMIFEGGLLPFMEAMVALLLVTAPRFVARAHLREAARMLGIAMLVCFLVAGVKLYPVMVQMLRWPTGVKGGLDALKWQELMPIFVDKERYDGLAGHGFHFNEYRAYVGPAVLGSAIAGAGAAIILKPRRWGLVVLVFGGLLFMRGAYSPTAPYKLMFDVFRWNALVVPSRFAVIALLGIAAAGAVAIDAALERVGHRRVLAAIVLVVAFVSARDPIVEANKVSKVQGVEPWLPRSEKSDAPYRIVDGGRMQELPARNAGTMACERILDTPHATALAIGDVPQVTPEAPDAGALTSIVTKQNGYTFHAALNRAAVVHVNTSWDPDWTTNVGTIRRAPNGQLDVALPAGSNDVVLHYSPRGFVSGMLATITGLLLVLGIAAWPLLARRRRARASNATPAPKPTTPTTPTTPTPPDRTSEPKLAA